MVCEGGQGLWGQWSGGGGHHHILGSEISGYPLPFRDAISRAIDLGRKLTQWRARLNPLRRPTLELLARPTLELLARQMDQRTCHTTHFVGHVKCLAMVT